MRRLLSAALVLAPSVAAAQTVGTFSGCGTYLCVTVTQILSAPITPARGTNPLYKLQVFGSVTTLPALDSAGFTTLQNGRIVFTAGDTASLGSAAFGRTPAFNYGYLPRSEYDLTALGPTHTFTFDNGEVAEHFPNGLPTPTAFVGAVFAFDGTTLTRAFENFALTRVTTTPEPATLALAAGGVLLLGAWARRRRA